jgi:hypothetical protein
MSLRKTRLIIGIAILCAFTSDAAQALISPEGFCQKYAESAVAAYADNVASHCGLSDGRWMANYQVHYDWCMATDPNNANTETKARTDILAQCKSSASNTPAAQPSMPALIIHKFPKPAAIPGKPPAAPQNKQPQVGLNLNFNLGSGNGVSNGLTFKKFKKPMYKGARLDFCMEDNTGCGQDAADAFCEAQGFGGAARFSKARGKGIGYDTIQIGTGDANDNEPASAFKSITCEQ